MTSKSRARKFNKKRSNPDDDPYTVRLRKASDAAKAARARTREADRGPGIEVEERLGSEAREDRAEESRSVFQGYRPNIQVIDEVQLIEKARLKGVSLVPTGEGTGYILEVGADSPLSDDAELEADIEAQENGWEPLADWERELLFAGGASQEAVRTEASPDTEALGQRGTEGTAEDVPEDEASEPSFFEQVREVEQLVKEANGEAHLVFFEAEVNGLPTHVDTQDCYCEQGVHHWIEVGEK